MWIFREARKSFLFVQGAILLSGESAYYGGFLKGGATSLRKSSYSFPFLPTPNSFEFLLVNSEARRNDKNFRSIFLSPIFSHRIWISRFFSFRLFFSQFEKSIEKKKEKRKKIRNFVLSSHVYLFIFLNRYRILVRLQ